MRMSQRNRAKKRKLNNAPQSTRKSPRKNPPQSNRKSALNKNAPRSTRKSPRKNTPRSSRKSQRKNLPKQTPFKVGDKVNAQWLEKDSCYGDWYNGVIEKIDEVNETAHVVFDDGDFDEALSWKCIAITE